VGLAFAPDFVIAGIKQIKESHPSKALVAHAGPTTAPATQRAATTQESKSAGTALDEDDSDDPPLKPPTGKQLVIAIAVMLIAAVGIVLGGPLLVAVSGFPIGTLIVGFALWEAWKMNASKRLSLAGPYSLTGRAPNIPQPLPPVMPSGQ